MDPMPTMSRAFSLILHIEQQKEISTTTEMSAISLNFNRTETQKKVFDKKKLQQEKRSMICEVCNKKWHGKDTYFKIHEVPEWFKELAANKAIMCSNAINFNTDVVKQKQNTDNENVELKTFIRNELKQLMINSTQQSSQIEYNNATIEYASNAQNYDYLHSKIRSLVLDSGAFCPISNDSGLFQSLQPLKSKPSICLHDGSVCTPELCGTMFISPHILLEQVYFVPEFKINLISMGCLVKSSGLCAQFLADKWIIQDLSSKKTVAEI